MWDLPRPGFKPMSPALPGRFSTTAPPGKPHLPFLNAQLSGIKYVHIVSQPSAPSTSRTFSSPQTETLSPWNTDSPSPSPAPGPHHLRPVSVDLSPLGSGIRQCLSFYVWLISLSIMSSRFIHIVVCISASFLKNFNCSKKYVKFIILTIFKCTIQWC